MSICKNLLIGLSGKMGSGKNYIAEKILPIILNKMITNIQYYYIAFGDQMKVEVGCRNKDLSYDSLFNEKTKEVRQMLQEYGTKNGRDKYGEDIWIRSLSLWMEIYKNRTPNKNNIFIVTDVRFRNEAQWIKQHNGILLRVNAPNRTASRVKQEGSEDIQNHLSETDLDNYPFEYVINNDIEEQNNVLNKLREIAIKESKERTNFA
uniref:Uncharacterized protein n=1 Tax=viral metagenome TaxID=1070528 RepID=A0A6C0LYL1_9ZZZZ